MMNLEIKPVVEEEPQDGSITFRRKMAKSQDVAAATSRKV
jgi:hypothetical protein